jgi:hypothetical protein
MWLVAVRRWDEQELNKKDPDLHGLHEIAIHLARAEEQDGELSLALSHLELAAKVSGNPGMLRPQIIDLQKRLQAANEPRPMKQP